MFGIKTKRDREIEELKAEFEETLESYGREIRDATQGWTSVIDITGSNTDLALDDHQRQQEKAREAFFYSPAAKRQVRYATSYIMGKGFSIGSPNPAVQFIIKKFTGNPNNKWKTQPKLWMNREQTDGEVFITFFLGADGSSIARETDPYEIKEILTDPDDVMTPILYERTYEQVRYEGGVALSSEKTEYIPFINTTDEQLQKLNLTIDQATRVTEFKRIYHVKTLTYSNRKRGLSDFSATLYYLARLRQAIDNRLKLDKIKQGYYLDVTIDGGANDVTTEAGKDQYKRPPKAGSTLFHNKAIDVQIKQPNMNHKDANEALEPIMRQIVMGSGMPEWMIVGQANMFKAGAREQSAPFVKTTEDYQEQWDEDLTIMFTFIITWFLSKKKHRGMLTGTAGEAGVIADIDEMLTVPKMVLNPDGEMVQEEIKGVKIRIPFWELIQIEFPQIIERDEQREADAVTKDIANKIVSRETASTKRGYDYKEEKIRMDIEESESIKKNPLLMGLDDEHEDEPDEKEEETGDEE